MSSRIEGIDLLPLRRTNSEYAAVRPGASQAGMPQLLRSVWSLLLRTGLIALAAGTIALFYWS